MFQETICTYTTIYGVYYIVEIFNQNSQHNARDFFSSVFLIITFAINLFFTCSTLQLPVSTCAYTTKMPKMCQADLDFIAPEVQASSACSPQSDMFSLGLLICSIFNNGRSPIQSALSTTQYIKQLEIVSLHVLILSIN